jgi:rhodanese-related sulfurtransferase
MDVQTPKVTRDTKDTRARALEAYTRWARLFPELSGVSYNDLRQNAVDKALDPVLVDVRSTPELELSRIPGSITPDEFESNPERHRPSARPVVAVCTIGLRAGLWARRLARAGYAGPIYVSQGVLLHALDGGELVSLRQGPNGTSWQPVKSVHCFAAAYQFAPAGWDSRVFSTREGTRRSARFAPDLARALALDARRGLVADWRERCTKWANLICWLLATVTTLIT